MGYVYDCSCGTQRGRNGSDLWCVLSFASESSTMSCSNPHQQSRICGPLSLAQDMSVPLSSALATVA